MEHGWVYSLKVGKVEHGRFQVWAFGCFWKDSGFGLGLVCCPVRPVCRVRPVRPVLPRFKSRPSRSITFSKGEAESFPLQEEEEIILQLKRFGKRFSFWRT